MDYFWFLEICEAVRTSNPNMHFYATYGKTTTASKIYGTSATPDLPKGYTFKNNEISNGIERIKYECVTLDFFKNIAKKRKP